MGGVREEDAVENMQHHGQWLSPFPGAPSAEDGYHCDAPQELFISAARLPEAERCAVGKVCLNLPLSLCGLHPNSLFTIYIYLYEGRSAHKPILSF